MSTIVATSRPEQPPLIEDTTENTRWPLRLHMALRLHSQHLWHSSRDAPWEDTLRSSTLCQPCDCVGGGDDRCDNETSRPVAKLAHDQAVPHASPPSCPLHTQTAPLLLMVPTNCLLRHLGMAVQRYLLTTPTCEKMVRTVRGWGLVKGLCAPSGCANHLPASHPMVRRSPPWPGLPDQKKTLDMHARKALCPSLPCQPSAHGT